VVPGGGRSPAREPGEGPARPGPVTGGAGHSGVVDFAALPTAPNPSAAATTTPATATKPVAAAQVSPLGTSLPIALLALAGGLAAGVFATLRFAGNRRRSHHRRW